jgi:hypothetical protein
MFEKFLAQGNILAIVLMVYANGTMMEALKIDRADPYALNSPRILKNPLAHIFIFFAIPCAIWPAIYIGLYDGWLAGIAAWFVLQIISAIAVMVFGIRGFIGYHFIAACIAYPIAYYLSIAGLRA